MTGKTEVVVVGGGYAGVMAANRLTRRDDVAVTLVNPRPSFVERIRLHQLVGGSHTAVVDYREILAERVRLVVDSATRIDAAEREVTTAAGARLRYDYLIYAVGSGDAESPVPGVGEFAYPMATLEDAERLRAVLAATRGDAAVTVVGAGATGLEVAAELAEEGRRVSLVCGGVLVPYVHPRTRRAVAKRLARLGVTVLDGPEAKVTAVTPDTVRLCGGHTLSSAVTIWTAGFGVPDLAARSGLSTDALGRLRTDETLTSVDDMRIVAAGDAATPSDLPLRMSCQTARPLGAHAADTVLARIAGTRPATIDIGYFGQCIALGRDAAALQFASRHDVANGLHLNGRIAAAIKRRACRDVVTELALEAREPGTFTWKFGDPERARQVAAGPVPAPAVR
ncbi:NAD(P)/FAD-dependent oxidoreductase [Nocardia bovistercoris]|uniref:FAD-dependent oxidoreductase n=1 Tax=Nocardia bovistercoris TaxID=2785916 RepID=A0A931IAP6_9NOCA|nr:FAD-dependent oxidoreductase [Nocardia bovistercoris]MBH0778092.1 FAD-dependent oxidoreductase [Nocardia bovistercoris]